MTDHRFDIHSIRDQFSALRRTHNGRPVVFFDGPAGSQVPQRVADAVSGYMLNTNANHGGVFATGMESDSILDAAHQALADFVGAPDPDCISFGSNMTTLTLALSRALASTWSAGDEIIVSRLDHDANFTPWVLAARDAGAEVRYIDIDAHNGTLDLDSFDTALSDRTRLVAVGYASNLTGTVNPVVEITRRAHEVGALSFVDAVHFAPHGLIDVIAIDCDFLMCSAYKFFGPHVGVMYGKRMLLENLTPYKLRPASGDLPERWTTGTQNHEGIAGAMAAVDYVADLGRSVSGDDLPRRDALRAAWTEIGEYEHRLGRRLLNGLAKLPPVRIHGLQDSSRIGERVPTVSITWEGQRPCDIAERLAARGIFVWSGNHYALPYTEAAGLEPDGTLRIGLLHYNTVDEVDRLLEELKAML